LAETGQSSKITGFCSFPSRTDGLKAPAIVASKKRRQNSASHRQGHLENAVNQKIVFIFRDIVENVKYSLLKLVALYCIDSTLFD
jgi:hypothetical protein